jgi:hypothetical protein
MDRFDAHRKEKNIIKHSKSEAKRSRGDLGKDNNEVDLKYKVVQI